MKLRTKMMYLAGTASFLVFAAVMGLFFLSFSIFSRQIRSDGMKYTDRDLQERARGSLLRLKDSMLTAYVRTSTFYAAVNLPGAELIKVLKTRFAYSRVSDAQFYCEFDGAADPVFTGFYGLVMKDGKPQETASFPSVTESAEL